MHDTKMAIIYFEDQLHTKKVLTFFSLIKFSNYTEKKNRYETAGTDKVSFSVKKNVFISFSPLYEFHALKMYVTIQ